MYPTYKKILMITMASLSWLSTAYAGELQLEIDNIRNHKGTVIVSIFNHEKDFKAMNDNYHTLLSFKPDGRAKKVRFNNFPAGTYGIVIFHDENKNTDLDINALGLPKEGYAFSNNVGKYDVPTFSEAAFQHLRGRASVQKIKLIY